MLKVANVAAGLVAVAGAGTAWGEARHTHSHDASQLALQTSPQRRVAAARALYRGVMRERGLRCWEALWRAPLVGIPYTDVPKGPTSPGGSGFVVTVLPLQRLR